MFQFESGGMQDLLMKMKPDRIEDLIAANALYRPGPMILIPDYIDRKHGAKWSLPHPIMTEVLEETYGIMVYQEQVMRICNRLGDIPLRDAYTLIKAISKKKVSIIQKEKERFLTGCVSQGLEEGRGGADFRVDRAVRRLRLQQEPLDALCVHRLPDGLPEGPLARRVHGGPADL